MKSFESEARAAFAFLTDLGYTVAADPTPDSGRRPANVVVRFRGHEVTVETVLSLGFAGEDGIHTTVLTTSGSTDFGPTVAHKGHEMSKALRDQARQVADSLGIR